MVAAVLISAALVACGIMLAVNRLPVWFARSLRAARVSDFSLHASGEDLHLVENWLKALHQGIDARLQYPRAGWIARCEVAAPRWRPQVFEGAAFGCGALKAAYSLKWRELPGELATPRPNQSHSAYFGVGLWGAMRFGRNFDEFLRVVQAYDPWWRYLCLDGYGFKFGLMDFIHDRRAVAHLHAIPGFHRRAAFQGVGRALYFVFLSDRRGLIEAVADFAPQHDNDLIEGAAFAAAFTQPDRPTRALHFARAMPYEWRASAHLGMTLGWRARSMAEPEHFEKCIADLPPTWNATIRQAIVTAGELEELVRRDHAASAYGLWREKLAARFHAERLWEPVYVDATETHSGGEGAVR